LQCLAVSCSVLQCLAVCCSVLQCVAVCCSVLQCVAVCCSVQHKIPRARSLRIHSDRKTRLKRQFTQNMPTSQHLRCVSDIHIHIYTKSVTHPYTKSVTAIHRVGCSHVPNVAAVLVTLQSYIERCSHI